ncbi:putative sulfoacetate transporter SauU [compost metagenome]
MASASAAKPSPYRFVIETLLFLTYAVFGLSWIAITPLVGELQAEFAITSAQLGMINTLVSAAKVVAPLLTGLLAVRIGLKKTILLGSLCICFAAIAPFTSDFTLFLASRFVFGVGGAIVVTLLGPMVMQWFPKSEMPLINAFNNVAVNTGIAVTLFTTVPLAAAVGWRNALLVYALLSVSLMLAWAVLGRDHATMSAAGAESAPSSVRYADVWKMKETWIIALSFAGPLALYLAFNTWLPKYYMEAFGMSKATASQFTGLFNLVGIPSAIVAGILTKHFGLRRPFIIGAGVVMGFAAFGMFLSPNPVLITVAAILLGASLFTYVSPLFTTPMELKGMTPQHVSLMMGTVFSFAYLFSSLSPVLVGLMRDATGSFVPAFAIWAVFSWVLALGGLLLPETGPQGAASKSQEILEATVPAASEAEEAALVKS